MKVITKLCKTTKEYNEDFIGYGENYAFILDGATGLTKNIISSTSDASWYVKTFSEYLKKHIKENTAKEAVKNSLKDIRSDIDKYSQFINSTLEIPSACIALVKENKDNYEFFVLGDCSIIYGNQEKQNLVTNYDIRKLDNAKIKTMVSIAKRKKIDVCNAHEYIIEDLKKQRLLKNKSNGYYVLDVDETAVEHANYKIISKDEIEMIILMSDGFSAYYKCLNLENNYKTFFLKNYHTRVDTLYKQLRQREMGDKLLNKYPRFKVSDDASFIKIMKT